MELVKTRKQNKGEWRDEESLGFEDIEGKGNRKTKRNMERNCRRWRKTKKFAQNKKEWYRLVHDSRPQHSHHKKYKGILILSLPLYLCVHFDISSNRKKMIKLVETYKQNEGEKKVRQIWESKIQKTREKGRPKETWNGTVEDIFANKEIAWREPKKFAQNKKDWQSTVQDLNFHIIKAVREILILLSFIHYYFSFFLLLSLSLSVCVCLSLSLSVC